MKTWLSGMSPGSTTSGAFGSIPPDTVVGAAGVRAGVRVAVAGVGRAVAGAAVSAGTVAALGAVSVLGVVDVPAAIAGGVCGALLEQAEARRANATAMANVDELRMIHSWVASVPTLSTVRKARRADGAMKVSAWPELLRRRVPRASVAVPLAS